MWMVLAPSLVLTNYTFRHSSLTTCRLIQASDSPPLLLPVVSPVHVILSSNSFAIALTDNDGSLTNCNATTPRSHVADLPPADVEDVDEVPRFKIKLWQEYEYFDDFNEFMALNIMCRIRSPYDLDIKEGEYDHAKLDAV